MARNSLKMKEPPASPFTWLEKYPPDRLNGPMADHKMDLPMGRGQLNGVSVSLSMEMGSDQSKAKPEPKLRGIKDPDGESDANEGVEDDDGPARKRGR